MSWVLMYTLYIHIFKLSQILCVALVSAPNRWKDTHFKITVFVSSTWRDKSEATYAITHSDRSSVAIKNNMKYIIQIFICFQSMRWLWYGCGNSFAELNGSLRKVLYFAMPTHTGGFVTIELGIFFTESTKWKLMCFCVSIALEKLIHQNLFWIF